MRITSIGSERLNSHTTPKILKIDDSPFAQTSTRGRERRRPIARRDARGLGTISNRIHAGQCGHYNSPQIRKNERVDVIDSFRIKWKSNVLTFGEVHRHSLI